MLRLIIVILAFVACEGHREFSTLNVTIGKGPLGTLASPSMAEFDCIRINIIGKGIVDLSDQRNRDDVVDKVLAGERCAYPGVVSGPLSTTSPSTISLNVLSGSQRIVQVLGIDDTGATHPLCVEGPGEHCSSGSSCVDSKVFELGRAVVDIFKPTSVNISNTYASLDEAGRAGQRVNCGGQNGGGGGGGCVVQWKDFLKDVPNLNPSTDSTELLGIDTSRGGEVFAFGHFKDGSYGVKKRIRVFHSYDQGESWSVLTPSENYSSYSTEFSDHVFSPNGKLIIFGHTRDGSNKYHGVQLDSPNPYNSYSVSAFQYNTGYDTVYKSSGVGFSSVYVSGLADAVSGGIRGIVQKSVDDGSSFSNVYYNQVSLAKTVASSIFVEAGANDIIHVVLETLPSNIPSLHYLMSSDSGSSWAAPQLIAAGAVNDTYEGKKIKRFGSDIYLAAIHTPSGGQAIWKVFKLSGGVWSVIDTFSYGAGVNTMPIDMVRKSDGTIYVTGMAMVGSKPHWILRKSVDSGSTWNTEFDYTGLDDLGAAGFSLGILSNGELITGGLLIRNSPPPNNMFAVRKFSCY